MNFLNVDVLNDTDLFFFFNQANFLIKLNIRNISYNKIIIYIYKKYKSIFKKNINFNFVT